MVRPQSRIVTGLFLAACSYTLFAMQDAAVKRLVTSYAVPQILFLRSGVITALAFVGGGGTRALARVGHATDR